MLLEDFIRSILSSGYPAKENRYFMDSTVIHALTKLYLQNQRDNNREHEIIAPWSSTKHGSPMADTPILHLEDSNIDTLSGEKVRALFYCTSTQDIDPPCSSKG
jgi:hypothetical protein